MPESNSLTKLQREVYKLREQNDTLTRALVNLEGDAEALTLEMWERSGSQETRDGFAARALLVEWGNQPRALQRLGFKVITKGGNWKPAIVEALGKTVFDTPGVKLILDNDFKDTDAAWGQVLERTRKNAIHGNDDVSVKAAAVLAKIEGRYKQPENVIAPGFTSLHILVQGKDGSTDVKQVATIESHDPLALLSHEPSNKATRIPSDDPAIDAALSQ